MLSQEKRAQIHNQVCTVTVNENVLEVQVRLCPHKYSDNVVPRLVDRPTPAGHPEVAGVVEAEHVGPEHGLVVPGEEGEVLRRLAVERVERRDRVEGQLGRVELAQVVQHDAARLGGFD